MVRPGCHAPIVTTVKLTDLARALTDVARVLSTNGSSTRRGSGGGSRRSRSRSQGAGGGTARATPSSSAPSPSPSTRGVVEYDHDRFGAPAFSYQPEQDGDPDPGEVVWGWVPYEEDASQGKDRPLLIVGTTRGAFVGVQLTSKNRASEGSLREEDGRTWFDVGTGGWDRQRRPSEARLDRVLLVSAEGIRREGAALPQERFVQVVAALKRVHGW